MRRPLGRRSSRSSRRVGFESDRERALEAALKACPDAREAPRSAGSPQLEKKRAHAAWIEEAGRILAQNATRLDLAQVARGAAARGASARRSRAAPRDAARRSTPTTSVCDTTVADLLHEQGDFDRELAALLERSRRSTTKETAAIERIAERLLAAKPDDPRVVAMLRLALQRIPTSTRSAAC